MSILKFEQVYLITLLKSILTAANEYSSMTYL